tara:strand:+ start:347 stop:646 length:300 start_codon:yes stop_codon:yes gene_type:complete
MILDHTAIRKAYPTAVTIEDGKGAFDKDGKSITLVQSAIDAARTTLNNELAATKYQRDREAAYDTVKNQLDQLYWDKKNGTNKWVESIDKVKSDNPKPS